jgi:hypothetical protein
VGSLQNKSEPPPGCHISAEPLVLLVYKSETFHGVCLQKKMKEERAVRRSIRGSVKNEQKVARVHADNMKTEIDSSGQLKFVEGTVREGCSDGVVAVC